MQVVHVDPVDRLIGTLTGEPQVQRMQAEIKTTVLLRTAMTSAGIVSKKVRPKIPPGSPTAVLVLSSQKF